ncbi:hypothetical protein WA158_004851 [Blastocystis sp. Blastoise]
MVENSLNSPLISEEDSKEKRSYEDQANLFSKITLDFMTKIFKTGYKRALNASDLGPISEQDKPSSCYQRFLMVYVRDEKTGKYPPFFWSMVRATGLKIWALSFVLYILMFIFMILPPMILQVLVNDLSLPQGDPQALSTIEHWIYAFCLFIIPICNSLCNSYGWLLLCRVGIQMRGIATEALYRKTLMLNPLSRRQMDTGKILNMMSTDTDMIQMFASFAASIVYAPLLVGTSIAILSIQIGKLTLYVFGILFIMMVIQILSFGLTGSQRDKNLLYTDKRINCLNELILGIRVIKYYCWEKPFFKKVDIIREMELKKVASVSWISSLCFNALLDVVPFCIPLVIFSFYPSVVGLPLSPSVAFSSLALINLIRGPFMLLPLCFLLTIQFKSSIKRINAFLSLPERSPSDIYTSFDHPLEYTDIHGNNTIYTPTEENNHDSILIKDGQYGWDENNIMFNNINLEIPKGKLVGISGKVGSGKSALLEAIIGTLYKKSGLNVINGTVSYIPQQAWLLSNSIKENILFGKEYNEEKYKECLRLSCLDIDLGVIPAGDEALVGNNGINLSGGQKMRIAIARSYYSNADIMLFDDPLAAVDSHVGLSIFSNCIQEAMNTKTRLLVTNNVSYLSECDIIIVIGHNTIEAKGTFEELKEQYFNNNSINSTLNDSENEMNQTQEEVNIPKTSLLFKNGKNDKQTNSNNNIQTTSSTIPDNTKNSIKDPKNDEIETKNKRDLNNLISSEEQQTGSIPWSVYSYYFKSCGISLLVILCIICIITYTSSILSQYVLSSWSEDKSLIPLNITNFHLTDSIESKTSYYVHLYCICILILILCFFIMPFITVPARIHGSKLIHNQLLTRILYASMNFFDITPVGQILNRFNRDINNIDNTIPSSYVDILKMTCSLIVNVIQIVITTSGIMILPLLFLLYIFYYLQLYFRKTNTDLQRIESISHTPLFIDFQSVLSGIPVILASKQETTFIQSMEQRLTTNVHISFLFKSASSWFLCRSNFLIGTMNFIIVLISNIMRSFISPGLLGIALNSSIDIQNSLLNWVLNFSQLEAQMNSVERVKYYIDTVEPESNMIIEDHRPPENWPTEGAIKFDNFEMRYRNGPKVLKGVNMDIHPMEKVGVVGRTGAGKSSLMVGLFRISECCGGAIYMDNIKLEDIGLEDVRRHLCIIPQDPVLFSASVRFNLDPFNESSDEEIWRVLEEVELKEAIDALPGKLDGDVHEGGSNFSVGQRQLICMARALLKRPKVLIMDEATASLDNETDGFLQTMIRKQFVNCTVLTIAHRLNTIMDSDRVCVMDQGIVAEFDTPLNLLNNPNSIFSGMVEAANDPNLYTMVKGYKKCISSE